MRHYDGRKNPERRKHLDDTNETLVLGQDKLPFKEYRKISTTYAIRIDEEFVVDTLEGVHRGKPGDYLAVGQAGEMYPIDAAVFAATYVEVD